MALFPFALTILSAGMHTDWNILARSQRSIGFFLRLSVIVAAVGLALAAVVKFSGIALLPSVWRHMIIAGCSQDINCSTSRADTGAGTSPSFICLRGRRRFWQ